MSRYEANTWKDREEAEARMEFMREAKSHFQEGGILSALNLKGVT